ncbi:MAG: alpha-2-macroglobulin family protein [Rhodobacteraceae bacterium]|nr:alpha-2-macroglobulin family protein [Paracoccaceae bacterium]
MDKVGLEIYRVGDRNLLRALQDGLLTQPLSRWDMSDLQRNLGQKVWSGEADVEREQNREVITALPVGAAITTFKPGAYVMTARDPNGQPDDAFSTQWFVVTDLGVSSMVGNDGLHVFTRSLGSAAPVGAVKVQLLARNNEVLGEAVTDPAGYAHFAPGLVRGSAGNAPAMITVMTEGGDFAFLNQGAAEFDLSDRGVAGRVAPPPIDAFLATDRGAYRPGEQVHATLLARDHKTAAIRDLPLTLELLRPDGVLFSKRLVSDNGAGGGTATFDLPSNARRGTWKLRVYGDQKAAALLERRILVEDFVPERIDFDLAIQQASIRLTDRPVVSIDAKYLYGAPGGDLPVEGEIKLTAVSVLKGYNGFTFGRADERFDAHYASVNEGWQTGADGHLDLKMDLPQVDTVNKPLQIEAYIRLREGSGRPVERRIKAPIEPSGAMIGIKPLFDGQAGEGAIAQFDIIAVGAGLARVELPRVGWVLNRIHTRYQWFQSYGDWDYEPITRRERIASGEVALGTQAMARIAAPVEYGKYELKLISQDEPYTASSYQFSAGWYVTSDANDTPDTLQVALDRGQYGVGEVAKLRISARFAGVAQISVLSDRLIETRTVDISKGANSVDMIVTPDWGAGAYVTVSAIRPMDVAAGRNPARALGLVYAKVDPAAKLLTAHFVNAHEAQPRAKLTARLKLDGVMAGQQAYATIAAVDVGVLNLTGFETPSPDDHYFGQRKLGIGIRDVYGRLIDGLQGNAGKLRSGGDGAAQQRLNNPPPTEEVLAQFSGMLVADENGEVLVDFDLPDFNGTLRLMAVVWSEKSVGHAVQDVLVRDPVVLVANGPRFLAPGDETQVQVELAHAFGPTGNFEVAVSVGEGLQTAGFNKVVQLADKQRKTLVVPIVATATGLQSVNIWVKTPDGKTLSKSLKLPVLHNDPEVARQTRLQLAGGQSWLVDASVTAGLHAGTVRATLAVGTLAQFDAPGLLSALDRYPYGCTEQITSKAMPLLYFEQLSSALGLAHTKTVQKRVNQAITAVLSNQASNGAFGLWRPNSGDLWLDAYVSDFLSRAKKQGFSVPDRAFGQALNNLRNRINYAQDFEEGGEGIAYALMVLAREGNAVIGDLRYYADTHASRFATPLAQAQLGAALTSYGDQSRADRMFRLASKHILRPEPTKGWRDDYGSHLRDAAAMLTLAVDAGTQAVDRDALVRTITRAPIANRSTQENLWSLLAAHSLTKRQTLEGVSLNGVAMTGPLVRGFSEEELASGQSLSNNSGRELTAVTTVFGVPSEPEPAGGHGYKIEREYYTLEGVQVTPDSVARNTRLVVVLRVTPQRTAEARLMVNDPLPAGFEIDNPNLIRGGETSALEWLETYTDVEHSEFRTDRFLTAVNWSGTDALTLAYIVRAVTNGRFHHPAASVEDMYRPEFRARTAAGLVEVSAN